MYEKAQIIFNIYNFDDPLSKRIGEDELSKFVFTIHETKASLQQLTRPDHEMLTQEVYEIMEKYDENRDDQLSLEEFKRWFAQDKAVHQFLELMGVLCSEDVPELSEVEDEDLQRELAVNEGPHDDERT